MISYGPAITSSYDACNTAATVLKQAGYTVSYVDVGAQLGGSFSSAVQRMQQAGTDFVISLHAGDRTTSRWPGTSSSTGSRSPSCG